MFQNNRILKTIIASYKTQVHHFDFFTKSTTNVWKYTDSPTPKKIRQTKFADKVMMIIIFDHKGVICQHVVLAEFSVNVEYYVSVLKILL